MARVFINVSRGHYFDVLRGLALSPYAVGVMLDPVYVPFGTSLEDVISTYLPEEIEMEISNGSTIMLDVTWSTENYDDEIPGSYTFTASYELPEFVWQLEPLVQITVISSAPAGYKFLIDYEGTYVVDYEGKYVIAKI